MKKTGLLVIGLAIAILTNGQTLKIQGGTSISKLDWQLKGMSVDPFYNETLIGYSIVITSYSIHYTKLYEFLSSFTGRRLPRVAGKSVGSRRDGQRSRRAGYASGARRVEFAGVGRRGRAGFPPVWENDAAIDAQRRAVHRPGAFAASRPVQRTRSAGCARNNFV